MNRSSLEKPKREDTEPKYLITEDYHTHTRYSKGILVYYHGKGTIEENMRAAAAQGLHKIGITDHGPGHLFYGLDLRKVPEMRQDIQRAKQKYPGVEIQLGVEANIIDTENGLDVPRDRISQFDYINAGYHHGVPGGNMIRNPIYSMGHYPSGSIPRLRAFNTEIAVRAIYENPIRILTHPGDKGPFDIRELAKACEERGTLLEINERHIHLTAEEIRLTMDYDVSYVLSSDAHRPEEVGSFRRGLERAIEAGLDLKRIVNLEHL